MKTPKTPRNALELIAAGARQVMALYPGCESASLVVSNGMGKPGTCIRIYPEADRPKPASPSPSRPGCPRSRRN